MRPPGLIVLAAGGSTRMKRPKQLMRWGNDSLLQLACKTALQSPCRPVVVVLGNEAEACRQDIAGLPVTITVHPGWQKGLGTSIAVGISALEEADPGASGALIILVDQPTVTPELLKSLVAAWSPPQRPVSATSYGGSGGVPAVFDRTLFPKLKTLHPERGARELISREIAPVTLIEPGTVLIDLDTPEFYEQHVAKTKEGPDREPRK